jgi:hypothetical protein
LGLLGKPIVLWHDLLCLLCILGEVVNMAVTVAARDSELQRMLMPRRLNCDRMSCVMMWKW